MLARYVSPAKHALTQFIEQVESLQQERTRLTAENERLKHELEIERATEICTQCSKGWSPSLIESGWCIFCILKERDQQLTQLRQDNLALVAEIERLKNEISNR